MVVNTKLEFERVFRWGRDRWMCHEQWTPLVCVESAAPPPEKMSVNGEYQVSFEPTGTVRHVWGEKYHTDCISMREGGWEFAVYHEQLHKMPAWKIYGLTPGVEIVRNPFIDNHSKVPKQIVRPFRWLEAPIFLQLEVKGGLEYIRQRRDKSGCYYEKRGVIGSSGSQLFHVKHAPKTDTYDAMVFSFEGYEEKWVLRE
jgi:hypothetical protein